MIINYLAAASLFCLIFLSSVELRSEEKINKKIIFLSNREGSNGKFNLFLLDLDNMVSKNLSREINNLIIRANSLPRINHKRNSIIFISFNQMNLMELNLKTKNVKKITEINYEATNYEIAHDGNSILYTEKVGSKLQLYEVDIKTGLKKNLSNNQFNNFEATYSGDDKKIAFVSDKDGSNSIGIMNRDGSDQKILTNSFGDDRYPNFSPDNKKIVFSSSRSGLKDSDYDLYMINTTGEHFELFYHSESFNAHPIFSPDYKFVAFISNARGNMYRDIFIIDIKSKKINSATSQLKNIINDNFVISNDSNFIVFDSMDPPNSDLMMYNVSTNQIINLTNNKNWDCSPTL